MIKVDCSEFKKDTSQGLRGWANWVKGNGRNRSPVME